MADIHVLETHGGLVSVVLHIPVPDANNTVGVAWKTALLNSGMGGNTSLPDGDGTNGTISAPEKTLIESGELYEHRVTNPLDSGGKTTEQRRVTLRAMCVAERLAVIKRIQKRLEYFGHTESEA